MALLPKIIQFVLSRRGGRGGGGYSGGGYGGGGRGGRGGYGGRGREPYDQDERDARYMDNALNKQVIGAYEDSSDWRAFLKTLAAEEGRGDELTLESLMHAYMPRSGEAALLRDLLGE